MTDAGAGQAAPGGRRLLLLIGAVGAGKGTQAETLARELGLVHLASGNLFRQALRDGTDGGEARAGVHGARRPGSRRDHHRHVHGRACQARRSPRRHPGWLPAHGDPGGGARRDPRPTGRAHRAARSTSRSPTDDLVERVSGRWVCPTCGTPYHAQIDPPRQPGVCDKDGDHAQATRRRPAGGRPGEAGEAGAPHARGDRALPGVPASWPLSTASSPSTRSAATSSRLLT